MSQPLVTIAIPVYNGAPFMRRALDAVFAQDYENVEIIASDNGSADESLEILREYAGRHPEMRILRQETNIGVSGNFLVLLAAARGTYFFWACCDDSWHPSFTRKLVDALKARPEAAIAFPGIRRVSEDGTLRDVLQYGGRLDPSALSHFRAAWNCARGSCYHLGFYGLWRTEFLRRVFHGYPSFLASDRLFMCGVALATRFAYVPEPLYTRVKHEASTAVRYAEEDLGAAHRHPLRFFRSVLASLPFLLFFPAIPLRRRLLAIPVAARFSAVILRWMFVGVCVPLGRRWLPEKVYRAASVRTKRLFRI
jgi:glycosyltransferase involved in cell wall biosynthesis